MTSVSITVNGQPATDIIAPMPQPVSPPLAPMADIGWVEISTNTIRGSLWSTGNGPPTDLTGNQPGDMYLDVDTGDIYEWNGASWEAAGNFAPATDTPQEILDKLLTVDGAGSGLDADLLDGQHGAYYATKTSVDTANAKNDEQDTRLDLIDATNTNQDTALALKANIASPTFTGDPKAPTPSPGDNDTSVATTAYVTAAVAASNVGGPWAPIASPIFTGDPRAPTPTAADNDTSIATTAFVKTQGYLTDAVASTIYAPIASPTFTGDPRAPTPATSDNDTSLATTAYVKANLAALPPSGIPEAPLDGFTYGRKNATWATVVGGAIIADAPPSSPQPGQTWWESDTGLLYIWYADADSSQWVQIPASAPVSVPPLTLTAQARSRVVNGAMQISQEQGNTVLGPTNAMASYAADQWLGASQLTTGTCTQQRVQVVTPNGSVNRIRLTVNTANTSPTAPEFQLLMQIIEGIRVADFRYGSASAKQAVLRFGWKSPAGTYSVALRNSVPNRTYLANFTISAGQANTDTEQIIIIPGDTAGVWAIDNTYGLSVTFGIASGTTYRGAAGWQAGSFFTTASNTNGLATAGNVFELFDVGLYLDDQRTGVAPPWAMPDEAQELAACQRYWHKVSTIFSGQVTSGGTYYALSQLKEVMRAAPALSGTNVGNSGFAATMGSLGPFNPSGDSLPYAIYDSRAANGTNSAAYFQSYITCNARM